MCWLLPMTHPPSAPWALTQVLLTSSSRLFPRRVWCTAYFRRKGFVGGWGDQKLSLGWRDGDKAQGSRNSARIPEMLCPKGGSQDF